MKSGNRRTDVRAALIHRGWASGPYSTLCRGSVSWASFGVGDSSVTRYTDDPRRALYTIEFTSDVPAEVIVSCCEAVAKGERRA